MSLHMLDTVVCRTGRIRRGFPALARGLRIQDMTSEKAQGVQHAPCGRQPTLLAGESIDELLHRRTPAQSLATPLSTGIRSFPSPPGSSNRSMPTGKSLALSFSEVLAAGLAGS